MRIFVAGASGAIGVPLVRLLVAAGHTVAGMTRSEAKVPMLRELGAEPVVCNVYDAAALERTVVAFRPDAVIHELTDLPDDERELRGSTDANARMREEGTRNVIAAAQAAGASRLLVQSIAFRPQGGGSPERFERPVLDAGGVVLRYGYFYGPGTWHPDGRAPDPAIHVEEAARRTVEALDAPSGVIEVVEGA